ncbi:hypothetical protein HELRODRAFT_178026 [Helobdella robusta]|uniref:Uncharacterized protein n=1 Tax=Helobdella robusta TaxID=6412 RepID=T1FCM5_HELRO|nr:hypothetical protein HELRODRAFT_178026 [Helobdella robusta]ESN97589.1 hypothetical protein HELRODRAFT_178026 [Helobdella robusta]
MENQEILFIPGFQKQVKIPIGMGSNKLINNPQLEILVENRPNNNNAHDSIDNAIIYQNLTTRMVRFIMRNYTNATIEVRCFIFMYIQTFRIVPNIYYLAARLLTPNTIFEPDKYETSRNNGSNLGEGRTDNNVENIIEGSITDDIVNESSVYKIQNKTSADTNDGTNVN